MTHLRSSSVHHLGFSSSALVRFQKRHFRSRIPWRGKAQSPQIELFNAHNRHLVSRFGLEETWIPSRVESLVRSHTSYQLETTVGPVRAKNVILALGPLWKREIPDWLKPVDSLSSHLLDPDFNVDNLEPGQSLAILGGGMSSLQSALSLSRQHQVTVLTRSCIRQSEFDVQPGWMGPVNGNFLKLSSDAKRTLVNRKKNRGTVSKAVFERFHRALKKGLITCHELNAPDCELQQNRALLRDEDQTFLVDKIILGTGFKPSLHPLHYQVAQKLGAPLSNCQTPILDKHLQWLPQLFVAGCHAELQLGPVAGNILGAKLAADRILSKS